MNCKFSITVATRYYKHLYNFFFHQCLCFYYWRFQWNYDEYFLSLKLIFSFFNKKKKKPKTFNHWFLFLLNLDFISPNKIAMRKMMVVTLPFSKNQKKKERNENVSNLYSSVYDFNNKQTNKYGIYLTYWII